MIPLLVGLLVLPALRTVSGQEVAWSGSWVGTARHLGEESPIAFALEPVTGGRAVIRMTIPAIHAQGVALGPLDVEEHGDSIRLGPFRFVLDRDRGTLTSVLPTALVPVYRVPITLHRVNRIDPPARPELRAPERQPEWVFDAGAPLWSGVTFSDGLVFAGDDAGVLHALDAATGRQRWSFRARGALRALVTVAGGALYVQADDGYLYALSARDGGLRWRSPMMDSAVTRVPIDRPESRYDVFGSAVTTDGERLFLGTAQGRLVAVDAATGALVWAFTAGDAIVAAPAVVDGRVVFGSFDHHVYALDRQSGRLLWRYDTGAPVVSTPAVADGRAIIGSRSYDLLALDLRNGTPAWTRYVWFSWIESSVAIQDRVGYVGSSDAAIVLAFDTRTGEALWQTDVFGRSWGRPLVHEGRVYVGASGVTPYLTELRGGLVALERATGRPVWQFPMPRTPSAPYGVAGSLAYGAGLVFAAGLDGRVYAFSP